MVDYGPGIYYEGSEPKIEPDAREEKKANSKAKYTKMELSHDRHLQDDDTSNCYAEDPAGTLRAMT